VSGRARALLLAHAAAYAFLADDAFISFRYAQNLARGEGLVFNPGERVEGYTNFLWVVLLAGLDALGVSPEDAAPALGLLATVVLWALVGWFALRDLPGPGRRWLSLVPLVLLGATRSVAVFATSGLETRLFEVLVLAGAFAQIVAVERHLAGGRPRWVLAAALLGAATLTRPDGLLVSLSTLAASHAYLLGRRRFSLRAAAAPFVLYAGIVLGHFGFRYAYYGEWLPNTYYAKVGGELWFEMGGAYLATFVLEYGAVLWVPLLVAGIVYHRRRGTSQIPLVFAAVVLPHALYVAAVGGDHFEYRPLDLYFAPCFLLLCDGAKLFAGSSLRRVLATAAYLGIVLVFLVALPLQSALEFPDRHIGGFPGRAAGRGGSASFLAPERSLLYDLPGLRLVAGVYRDLLRRTTASLVGVRAEEHRLFADLALAEGRRLRAPRDAGVLPGDTHLALPSIGAVGYLSGFRILDRLGLTDAEVARAPSRPVPRLAAHAKSASFATAASRGVDLWTLDAVRCVWHVTEPALLSYLQWVNRQPARAYLAAAGNGLYVLAQLPQGPTHAARRFPRLRFRSTRDPEALRDLAGEAKKILGRRLAEDPSDLDSWLQLANILAFSGDAASASRVFEALRPVAALRPVVEANLGALGRAGVRGPLP
jgi:hypothetical protein